MLRSLFVAGLMTLAVPVFAQSISDGTKVPPHPELRITVLVPIGNFKAGDICVPTRFGSITVLAQADDTAGIRYVVLGHTSSQECTTDTLGTIPVAALRKALHEHARKSEDDFMTDFRKRQELHKK